MKVKLTHKEKIINDLFATKWRYYSSNELYKELYDSVSQIREIVHSVNYEMFNLILEEMNFVCSIAIEKFLIANNLKHYVIYP